MTSTRSSPSGTRRDLDQSSALHRLAGLAGIVPEYLDQTGTERRETTDATRIAILRALGIDASTEERAAAALEAWESELAAEPIAPVRVVEVGSDEAERVLIRAHADTSWELTLVTERDERRTTHGRLRAGEELEVRLREPLPIGYHTVRLTLGDGSVHEQSLIVVPPRCTMPDELLAGDRAFGVIANLYTLRSERNWGIGDLTDLATLARWAGSVGADFVGVNPLHALLNRGGDVSPYSPVSRLFRNVAYVDVESVPELALAPRVVERLDNAAFQQELAVLRASDRVRYEQVAFLKLAALRELYEAFAGRADPARRQTYYDWVARQPELPRFATWMAIGEAMTRGDHFGRGDGTAPSAEASARPEDQPDGYDWRSWPEELRDADSDAVQVFAREHIGAVDFHMWLQFEADRQLAEAAREARDSGLRIGLYQDLAIGTSATSSDAWSFRELFVTGACIGAPPDPYAATGQNWGLPPIDPRALRRDRYRYFIALVRNAFRHSGALRIDHVMGLFRLFWIPEGLTGKEGAYVRYPAEDLLGILALESVRNRAIVVGEDLGTVPPDVPPALAKWGVLSSKVMYFERGDGGSFKSSDTYPEHALATANTHDMATLAGFWLGRDVELRREVGLIETDDDLQRERENRAVDREQLAARLEQEELVPTGWGRQATSGGATQTRRSSAIAELRGAVHELLCRSPSALVGLSLDDLTAEVEPVNVPGVGPDRYPSWTRRMRMSLEQLPASVEVRAALRCGERGRHA